MGRRKSCHHLRQAAVLRGANSPYAQTLESQPQPEGNATSSKPRFSPPSPSSPEVQPSAQRRRHQDHHPRYHQRAVTRPPCRAKMAPIKDLEEFEARKRRATRQKPNPKSIAEPVPAGRMPDEMPERQQAGRPRTGSRRTATRSRPRTIPGGRSSWTIWFSRPCSATAHYMQALNARTWPSIRTSPNVWPKPIREGAGAGPGGAARGAGQAELGSSEKAPTRRSVPSSWMKAASPWRPSSRSCSTTSYRRSRKSGRSTERWSKCRSKPFR